MKLWVAAVIAVGVGAAAAAVSTIIERSIADEQFDPYNARTAATEGPLPQLADTHHAIAAPRVHVVNGSQYHFGTMDYQGSLSHQFILRNAGDAPLKIEKRGTTCKCTISEVGQGSIPPGEEVAVTLEWEGTTLGDFRQVAELATNDPDQEILRLVIEGHVSRSMQVSPSEIVLGRISARGPVVARFRVTSARAPDLQVADYELLDRETAQFFDLKMEPLSDSEFQPAQPGGAKSGFEVELTVKPGLPLGRINQTIRLTTTVEGAPDLEVPVTGTVISDISVLGGRNFFPEANYLRLGTIKSSAGAAAQLHVLVKGADRHHVEVHITSAEPENILQASLGEGRDNGSAILYPLNITIPKGVRAINRLGTQTGKVILETNHPQVKQLDISVQFAVEAS